MLTFRVPDEVLVPEPLLEPEPLLVLPVEVEPLELLLDLLPLEVLPPFVVLPLEVLPLELTAALVTMKLPLEAAALAAFNTLMMPVVPSLGTVTFACVSLTTLSGASCALPTQAEARPLKPEPVTMMVVPAGPEVGENPAITGWALVDAVLPAALVVELVLLLVLVVMTPVTEPPEV